MSQLSALKAAKTREDLAALLGYKQSAMSYLLYKLDDSKKYKIFDIPKKRGGVRKIFAPCKQLRLMQRRLCDLLQNCNEEIIGRGAGEKVDRLSHGFKRQRSIMTNAKVHRKRRFVFNIDLEGFFDSINFGRVRGFFINNREFSLDPFIATLIAQIACFDNRLPQGSPCSPVISNMIGHILDIHLNNLVRQAGCSYSRYADDITISTNKKEFPSSIASRIEEDLWVPGDALAEIIKSNGFNINSSKTRMQYYFSRQEVTGLVVNEKLNVPKEYRHKVRAMVHSLFSTGKFELDSIVEDGRKRVIKKVPGRLSQLHGMLGFIDSIDWANKHRNGGFDGAPSGISKIYRRFLFYKEFFTANHPVVICEGKTDNIYITQAIRRLAEEYPILANVSKNNQVEVKIRRFRYTEASTGRVLGIRGGAGDLKHFVLHYTQEAKKVVNLRMENPVILLVDNDKATDQIFAVAKEITKKLANKNSIFTHIVKNLYLMAVPSPHSDIEELFDDNIKNKKIGNRTFSAASDADPDIFYGKADFAYKVVMKHADEIDFSGFKPLLDRFVSVIEHYQTIKEE